MLQLGQSIKNAGLGIRNAVVVADWLFEASASATQLLVDSPVNSTDLAIKSHWQCMHLAETKMQKEQLEEESTFVLELYKLSKLKRVELESAAEAGT